MSYKSWFDAHAKKHKKIVDKLLACGKNEDEIIEYFCYENMVKKEIDFCLLYKDGKKCHDIQKLNCYLCACPNFRFNDNGLERYNTYEILSKCSIDNGSIITCNNKIHQDCSNCITPHHKSFIKKVFDTDWDKIMAGCRICHNS